MCAHLILSWLFTSTVLKEMNNLPRLPRIFIGNWAAVCYSCDWFYPAAGYELWLSRVPAAGYKVWLSRVLAARYKLRLTPSSGCLEFRRLDKGCGWLLPTADLCFGSWIRVTGHYILRLTRVPVAGYDLRLIPSCGWLRVATDSILQLTGVRRLDSTDLYFNISSNFKDLFWKICHFYGLFSTEWFQLPLIQALAAASRTLKKLEEAWSSLKKLQDPSCDWF